MQTVAALHVQHSGKTGNGRRFDIDTDIIIIIIIVIAWNRFSLSLGLSICYTCLWRCVCVCSRVCVITEYYSTVETKTKLRMMTLDRCRYTPEQRPLAAVSRQID